MQRAKSDYAIQTVVNAFRILEAFEGDEELGVTELSRRLGLHKNNVFRLLATLEEEGYVEQSSTSERYRLGVHCLELGQAYARRRTLLEEGRRAVETLAKESGETAHLATRSEFDVVHLAGETAGGLIATRVRLGIRLPCASTALGKVLLAFAPQGVREAFDRKVVGAGRLERRTPSTLMDREKLFDALQSVAGQGFALDLEECEAGLSCAAAPIFDGANRLVGALSVSAPAFRATRGMLEEHLAPRVQRAADALSRALGRAG